MGTRTEKLTQFFEQVKTLTFWQRLFKWSQFRSLSYEAYEEFKALLSELTRSVQELDTTRTGLEGEIKNLKEKLTENTTRTSELNALVATKEEALRQNQDRLKEQEAEIKSLKEKSNENSGKISELTAVLATRDEALRQAQNKLKDFEIEIAASKERINLLTQGNSQLKEQNTIYKQTEDDRKTQYEKSVVGLNSIIEKNQTDRSNEINEQHQKEIDRLNQMKETWGKHQDNVKNAIKLICDRHTIEYVEKVPFKGNPDNTIKICDEYVIFDAKSPSSDDLSNFPTYVKQQTELVKKYVKEENVKKDVFLVVPSNTVDVIDRFSYNMADYTVFVVTPNALEPIILSLKKLEEYAFVEQLSPEERNNICRVIGKFAYAAKRRIQIDHFFDRFFLEMLSRCESDLPADVLQTVSEYEKSEKLNPPQDKRGKQLLIKDLESESQKIKREAEAKGIVFPTMVQQEIKSLPLYEGETSTDEKEQ